MKNTGVAPPLPPRVVMTTSVITHARIAICRRLWIPKRFRASLTIDVIPHWTCRNLSYFDDITLPNDRFSMVVHVVTQLHFLSRLRVDLAVGFGWPWIDLEELKRTWRQT